MVVLYKSDALIIPVYSAQAIGISDLLALSRMTGTMITKGDGYTMELGYANKRKSDDWWRVPCGLGNSREGPLSR